MILLKAVTKLFADQAVFPCAVCQVSSCRSQYPFRLEGFVWSFLTCPCLNRVIQTSSPVRLCLKSFVWAFSGSMAVSKVCLCLQCEIQTVRDAPGFYFAALQLNTRSIYCALIIYTSCIKNMLYIHRLLHIVTYFSSLQSTDEWKWNW